MLLLVNPIAEGANSSKFSIIYGIQSCGIFNKFYNFPFSLIHKWEVLCLSIVVF
jgi:hypothetical protein